MEIIARIRSEFPQKFGIPRQSGLVEGLRGKIVFEPAYRNPEAVRGLEEFSHLWLLWQFSESRGWYPTVRPPRLGGNRRLGVFATRSPFRPSPIGLSCVRLERVEVENGPVLHVLGADLMDGTPILDIKPYLPYADCRPEAAGGFAARVEREALTVECPGELLLRVPEESRQTLLGVLAQDPRPSYHRDPERVYGMTFAGYQVRFRVENKTLTVLEIREQ